MIRRTSSSNGCMRVFIVKNITFGSIEKYSCDKKLRIPMIFFHGVSAYNSNNLPSV